MGRLPHHPTGLYQKWLLLLTRSRPSRPSPAATSSSSSTSGRPGAPCKVIGPVFEKLESSFPNIGFYKCDVDEQEQVAAEVGVKAMPTFMLFKGSEKVGSVVGADPNKLKAALQHHSETSA